MRLSNRRMNLLMPLAGFTAWAATHCPSEDLNLLPKRLCGDGHGANVHLSNGFQRDSDTAGKRMELVHQVALLAGHRVGKLLPRDRQGHAVIEQAHESAHAIGRVYSLGGNPLPK